MAGLLGDSFDDPKTQAVFQLAAGLLGGGNFGQALGRGLGGYQETMGAAKKQALLDEQMGWKRDEMNREKQQREKASSIEKLIQDAFLPMTGTQAIQGDALGPTVAKAQNIGQTQQVNPQQLIAQGVPFERVKQLMEAPNLGRSKVARTVKGIGPDGREYEYQVDDYGNKVGDGLAQFRAPLMQDLGGKVVALDPYTLQQKTALGKSMTPEGMAADQRGRESNNLARQRFEFEKNGGSEFGSTQAALVRQFGKPSPHHRWKPDGSQEFIPGGPADIKAGELGAKAEARKASAVASAGSVRNTVDEALNLVGMNTAGLGSWAAVLPATDARDLSSKLETIKANLGFDRLQQMRDQSPTGGALGAVAVQELTALQSTVSSLDQGQSPSQLRASLKKIDKHYKNMQAVMRGENPYDEKPAAQGQLGSGSFKILSVE